MGLFSVFPSSRKPVSGAPSLGAERHISPLEARKQVRFDLHDKLGRTKGEEVYNVLEAHMDKDGGFFDTHGVSGKEVDEMIGNLRENHRDNLHDHEVAHVEEILRKHFND
jgi:hypothetical protein